MARDYYMVLGLPRGASPQQIKSAFRRSAKRLHPDACGEMDADGFRELNAAYQTLSNESKRRAYDAALGTQGSWGPSRRPVHPKGRQEMHRDPSPVVPLQNPIQANGVQILEVQVAMSSALAFYGGPIDLEMPLRSHAPPAAGPRVAHCAAAGGPSGAAWLFA
jgi:curved DNA-binding protein CbpA